MKKKHYFQVGFKPTDPMVSHKMPIGVLCTDDNENGLTASMVAIKLTRLSVPEGDRDKYEYLPQHMGVVDIEQQ